MYYPKGFDIVLDSGESDEATVSAESATPGSKLNYGVRTSAGRSRVTVAVETEPSTTENTN